MNSFGGSSLLHETTKLLTLDGTWKSLSKALPYSFRSVKPQFQRSNISSLCGCGAFTSTQLSTAVERINKNSSSSKVIVVDLRRESHCHVNKEFPVSFFEKPYNHEHRNANRSDSQIASLTLNRVSSLQQNRCYSTLLGKKKVVISQCSLEREIVESNPNTLYYSIPVDDHTIPSPEALNSFISFCESISSSSAQNSPVSILYHCRRGHGRTTLFMIMHELLLLGKTVSKENELQTLVQKHYKVGGKNLFDMKLFDKNRVQWANERIDFLKQFVEFASKRNPLVSFHDY